MKTKKASTPLIVRRKTMTHVHTYPSQKKFCRNITLPSTHQIFSLTTISHHTCIVFNLTLPSINKGSHADFISSFQRKIYRNARQDTCHTTFKDGDHGLQVETQNSPRAKNLIKKAHEPLVVTKMTSPTTTATINQKTKNKKKEKIKNKKT